ncbi:Putative beta-barrel assembly-enhancing protease [Saliniradius amylolyticus]|uniref:Putative beta-barrel assembly-enhancing protease n=1 Tax=Saliniradius amylolyticus TaxID=2183582 RepID=A0A2S2E2K6_9ALTE|nr:M48 family metalloprotease [Saliniradius amylolyticus]AWL11864.1 Putative beta-barrel assembly-enhancing protease [Saliniradius amylolyticus]
MQRFVSFISAAILSFGLAAQQLNLNDRNTLPEIGVVAANAISIDKERLVGDAIMRQMRGQAPVVGDPLLNEYIQDLGNRLVAQADNTKFPFNFFLVNNPEINAFAFYGGYIGVHTGLIYQASTESELASVLAHEVAHVTQRHIARRMESAQRSGPLQIASMLGGILLAMADPEAGMAAISASSAAGQQASINYTRDNEKEADRIGLRILYQAGFDPTAAASFFDRLVEKYRHKSKPPAFLLTHPLPESRVADARARAGAYNSQERGSSLAFFLAKARIQALYMFDADKNQSYFRRQLDQAHPGLQLAARYGLALSLMRAEQPKQAQAQLTPLMDAHPDNLFFLDAMTDILLDQQNYDQAMKMLAPHLANKPRNQVLALNYANAAINAGQYKDAIRLLKDYLMINEDHMLSYQLLVEAYGQSDQALERHQSQAEIYALVAAYPRAIDELQSAYNYTGDSHLAKQRIRARIEQFREAKNRLERL